MASSETPPSEITPSDPESVQRVIDAAYKAGAKKIKVPPGVYRLSCPRGETLPKGAAYHLSFHGLTDFEIDATGATFVAATRDVPSAEFVNCTNVTLIGATFVHEVPPFSQGRIVAVSPSQDSVEVRVDAGYPSDLDDERFFGTHIPVFNVYDQDSGKLKKGISDIYISPPVKISDGLFRFPIRSPKENYTVAVGDRVAWRGNGFADLSVLYCKNMKFLNVTIQAASMQAIAEVYSSASYYGQLKITYGPKPPGAVDNPLLSTNADGYFLHCGAKGKGPTLENCLIEGVNDDGIAIHGLYAMGISSEGSKIICDARSMQPPDNGHFCSVGDTLRFYNVVGSYAGEARVTEAKRLLNYVLTDKREPRSNVFKKAERAEYWEYTLDKPIPVEFDWRIANADCLGSGFVIRNCTIRDLRNSGMRIKADNGLIEGCTIENTLNIGIQLSPEPFSFNESDYCRNITISHNRLINVNMACQSAAAMSVDSADSVNQGGGYPPSPYGHRNIMIKDNQFDGCGGIDIWIACAEGVQITENLFEHSLQSPFPLTKAGAIPPSRRSVIWLTHCADINISKNTVRTPGSFLEKYVGMKSPGVTGSGFEDGVTLDSSSAK